MYETAIDAFLPAKEVRLLVNAANTPPQEFYSKLGFVRVEQIENKMGDFPFAEYLYLKNLQTENTICIT